MLTNDLEMKKICAKMAPKNLTQDQKDNRRNRCFDFLEQIKNNLSFSERVITGDESWIFEYGPETKRQSFTHFQNALEKTCLQKQTLRTNA